MDSANESRLRALFDSVVVDPDHDPDQSEPFLLVGFQSPSFLFRGESLAGLRRLQVALSGSALSHGGPSEHAVEKMIIEACELSVTHGHDAAVQWLRSQLREPATEWTFLEPIRAYLPRSPISLGACELHQELSEDALGPAAFHAQERLTLPVILTKVQARDDESARLVARDRIDEARAILVLASGVYGPGHSPHLLVHKDGSSTFGGGQRLLLASYLLNDDGSMGINYRPLSEAAHREDGERTDWQRRTIAAVRWYATAVEALWPSQALIASMIALECLLIRDRSVRGKGAVIADEATRRWRLRDRSLVDQVRWIRDLYAGRNETVHEGRRYVEDLEVQRLVDLTSYAVRWATWHLNPYHHHTQAPCETFDEVMAHDLAEAKPV